MNIIFCPASHDTALPPYGKSFTKLEQMKERSCDNQKIDFHFLCKNVLWVQRII